MIYYENVILLFFKNVSEVCENDKNMCMVFYLSLSIADSEPSIQYCVCKIKKFRHLYNFIKQIKKLKERVLEEENESDDQTDKVTKGGVVVFGVIGELTDKDLLLFPKGNACFLLKKLIENLYRFMFHN